MTVMCNIILNPNPKLKIKKKLKRKIKQENKIKFTIHNSNI